MLDFAGHKVPEKSVKNGSFMSWWFPLIVNHYLNNFGVAYLIYLTRFSGCKWNLIEIMISAWWYKNEMLTRVQLKLNVNCSGNVLCSLSAAFWVFFPSQLGGIFLFLRGEHEPQNCNQVFHYGSASGNYSK